MTKFKKIIMGVVVILIGILFFSAYQFSAPQKEAEIERIVINLGTTEEELIPKLKEQGYIRNEWAFSILLATFLPAS
ncbi:unnamed protein product, partial [marine sediment metagenome]